MKTQLSQFPVTLHQPYSGVYQQQGRMITDADWNAFAQVSKDRLDRALDDVIGKGTPERGGIVAGDDTSGHRLVWGDAYVDGIRAVLAPRSGTGADFDFADQADFPLPPTLPEATHRLYLDVWERSLTALEESHLMDPALQGADSTTRTRTMAQVKVCPQSFDPEDQDQNPTIGEGRLTLSLRSATAAADDCEPCLDEIDVGGRVGNYAFRVEIHSVERDAGGQPTRLVLKWSRENGAEAAVIGDEPPGFEASDWVYEFYHSEDGLSASESHSGFHHPDVIAGGWTPSEGALVQGYPESAPGGFQLVRRWDGYVDLVRTGASWAMATELVDGSPVPIGVDRGQQLSTVLAATQHGHVSEGATVLLALDTVTVSLELADRQHLAGDYWIGVVREAVHVDGDVLLSDVPPEGILHHYMCLADVAADGALALLPKEDCKRFQFPRLTNLAADDICYDNSACEMSGVGNVQEALDHLCQQRDLEWHNKHLHGWGIVCGLIVECCDPDQADDDEDPGRCVNVTKGYAIDCEGRDIVLDGPEHVDLIGEVHRWDAENPNRPILTDGNGTACLHLALDAGQPSIRVEPHDGNDKTQMDQILDGTLLGDFVQHCILDLVEALTKELSFIEDGQLPSEDGKELVSQERRKFISFWNLIAQIGWKANGPYVWLSPREYRILKELYESLRDILGSKTFCGMFNDDTFPPYPFDDTKVDTWFGADQHTRIKADPSGRRVYTYGGASARIHVYDVASGELVEILDMAVPAGAEITALACAPDGSRIYVAASVKGEDTVLGIAQVGRQHVFERPMQIICGITITDMEVDPEDPELIFAVGLARGLFFLRPAILAAEEKPTPDPMYPFNAVGQFAIDTASRRAFCTAAATDPDNPSNTVTEVYDRVAVCNLKESDGGPTPEIRIAGMDDRFRTGRDDIAVQPDGRESRVHLVVDGFEKGGDKFILTFGVPARDPMQARLTAVLPVENTQIALAFDRSADTLYAAFEDSFRLQAIAPSGKEVRQMRIPVQLAPTDVAIGRRGDVVAVNYLSSTVTYVPRDEVDKSGERLARLADTRWRILRAFYVLVGNLFQYLKDCFCHHLLVKCPDCDGSEKIYLACVEIRDDAVYNICNFGKRKYVQTFMAWNYWLSIIPIIPMLKQAIANACCTVLPNFLDAFTDDITPPPPAPEFGAASGVAAPIRTKSARNAITAYKRTDLRTETRRQLDKLDVYQAFAADGFVTSRAGAGGRDPGLPKESLHDATTSETMRELERAGVKDIEIRAYDPALAGRYALDFLRTPGKLDPGAKVTVYELEGRTVFIAAERTAGDGLSRPITDEEEARLAELEARKAALVRETETELDALGAARAEEEAKLARLRAEREALGVDLQEITAGLDRAAELRRALKVDIDSLRPLRELGEINARDIAALEEVGIRTIGDLAGANATRLRTAGVGQDTAERRALIDRAKARLQ